MKYVFVLDKNKLCHCNYFIQRWSTSVHGSTHVTIRWCCIMNQRQFQLIECAIATV
jgi:hypothetical protein